MNRGVHEHYANGSYCQASWAQPSVHQTLEELDFERGIWRDACYGYTAAIIRKLNKEKPVCTVNSIDSSGYTALHYASRYGHLWTCEALIEMGAIVNCQTRSGKATPLHRAATGGHSNVVEFLLTEKANPMIEDADGKTALHKAAENGNIEIMYDLLSHSPALKTVTDNKGKTAIEYIPDDKKQDAQILDSIGNDDC